MIKKLLLAVFLGFAAAETQEIIEIISEEYDPEDNIMMEVETPATPPAKTPAAPAALANPADGFTKASGTCTSAATPPTVGVASADKTLKQCL